MIKAAKISPKQIVLLHVAKRELSLDDGNYRAVLSLYGGAESAKDVTQAGFTRLMNYLVRIGFNAPSFSPRGLSSGRGRRRRSRSFTSPSVSSRQIVNRNFVSASSRRRGRRRAAMQTR